MAMTKLVSINVLGLYAPGKRHDLYRELGRLRGDIVFLQETHLTHTTSLKLFSHQFPTWYYSLSDVHKAKGVAIGFRRGTLFTLDSMVIDPLVRCLFLKGSLGGLPCTLAIYAPNRDQVSFITTTFQKLSEFAHGCVLLAGDFNSPVDPLMDTSLSRSCISRGRLAFLRKRLHEVQSMDVWRIMHPREKDFTHYSHMHHSYVSIIFLWIITILPFSYTLPLKHLPYRTMPQ